MRHMANQATQQGMSLVELITTVSIMAILASIATPSFSEYQLNARRRQNMDDMWHAIFLARSEAIKRNSVVVLCKSTDGQQCDNHTTDWAQGWLVFDNLDHDDPAQVDSDEPVLRIFSAREASSISSRNKQTFVFRPFAQYSINGTLVFCDARGGSAARAIIISQTGRPRQSQRDANNRALTCP